MANIMSDDGSDDTTENYRDIVLQASEGVHEYLEVIAELQDASIALGMIEPDVQSKADEWARDFVRKVAGHMDRESLIPHYYFAAAIEAIHALGMEQLSGGLREMVDKKFVEAHI